MENYCSMGTSRIISLFIFKFIRNVWKRAYLSKDIFKWRTKEMGILIIYEKITIKNESK
jgi:hypothetical protein